MGKVNKKELLQKLEDRVEGHISDTMVLFQNGEEALLNSPSSSGGWSIAQCLAHLNSYGDYYLPKIRQEIEKAAENFEKQDFTSSWLGAYFTKMMEPETSKGKFKAFKGHIPPSELDAAQTVAEFLRQQEDMLFLLRNAVSKDMETIKIPVSILPFIKLRVGDVFQFIIAHDERHMQQAKRNLVKVASI
ncbi:MAG: DinB family protein [Dyadobacter sp.]|uniref:DinB family protein n=1 Tax=Dyadobacter sp. TaxID=1914288 RepID=UPI003263865A